MNRCDEDFAGAGEQILDSTPMLGAAAVQDTVTLVRSGIRKLLDALKVADSGAAGELRAGASLRLLPAAGEAGG